jgi:hypothetical protein
MISKVSTLCSSKVLSQWDSKFGDHVLHGVKQALFFTLKAIILQFMWSTFLKLFAHIVLIAQSKILQLNPKYILNKSIYAICTISCSFGVLFPKTLSRNFRGK